MPSVSVSTASNASGGVTVTPVVTNTTNRTVIVQFQTTAVTPANPQGLVLSDLVDTNPEVQSVEMESESGDNGLTGATLEPGQVLGVDGEGHDPTDSIVLHPEQYLATHPGQRGFAVDLNTQGESALTALQIFAVDSQGGRGQSIASFFNAVNTAPPVPATTPEPATFLLLGGPLMLVLACRCRK